MNELTIFNNSEFGEIRTVMIDGEPWFVASDICKALELTNTTMAIDRLDTDEKSKLNLGLSGGDTNCVNEYGLYSLVMASRKESAKRFKRWIAHDVIPSIRKTGTYSSVPMEKLSPQMQMILGMAQKMAEQEIAVAEAKQTAEKAIESVENMKENVLAPLGDWRRDVNERVRKIAYQTNVAYQNLFEEMYGLLESRAHCNLEQLKRNKIARMEKAGQTKTCIKNETTKLALIEEKPQLKEIFSSIVREYSAKYL